MTRDGRAARRIPPLAWVLVVAAVAQLAAWAAVNWYRIFGPYLIVKLEDVSSIVTGVAPFLLAAAALIGAARWPAGRRWLHAGAALSALHGVAQSVTDAWWAWRIADPIAPDGSLQVALVAGALIDVTAAALAPLCLAVGLVRARQARPRSSLAMVAPLAVGGLVVAGGLALLGRELAAAAEGPRAEAWLVALGLVHRLVVTLGGIGLVALALAAVRAMPAAGGILPEVLIAAGATMTAAGSAATWLGQSLLSFEEQSTHILWVFTAPWTVTSVGMVLVVAGFAVAAPAWGSARHRSDPALPEHGPG